MFGAQRLALGFEDVQLRYPRQDLVQPRDKRSRVGRTIPQGAGIGRFGLVHRICDHGQRMLLVGEP